MSWCTHPATVLKAGQAPSREHRACEQAVSWRNALHRACNWLEYFCQAPPALRDEPLLGTSLTELTAQLVRPCKPQSEEPKTRRRFDAQAESEPRKEIRRSPTDPSIRSAPACQEEDQPAPSPKRAVPACRTQPPKAERRKAESALLSRLCPEKRRHLAQAPSLPHTPPSLPHTPPSLPHTPRPLLLCPSAQAVPPQPASLQDWFRTLAERTHHGLRADANTRLNKKHRPDFLSCGKSDEYPESRLLDGQTIPESRLQELSAEADFSSTYSRAPRPAEPLHQDGDRTHRTPSGAVPPTRTLISRPPGHLELDADRAGEVERLPSSIHSSVSTLPETLPVLSSATAGATEPAASAFSSSGEGVSPATQFLLPLTATGMLRYSSKVGVGVQEEDLAILAEKIQRILNDEARRFGIAV
jgi:hypothetical protein